MYVYYYQFDMNKNITFNLSFVQQLLLSKCKKHLISSWVVNYKFKAEQKHF